ncbi:agmatinase [Mangrovicoccus sp. HB161399]|uniref:agmatinase n=1 Tax=Mangrovicoccus sp. HB161399 TaxID=2720392 RepID=UPI001551D4B4|nr:agmatinase [Mangrovicoccus sp. HB161399]
MIDPNGRWKDWPLKGTIGAKENHIGLPTFAGLPYSEDPADLAGCRAAIIGAPWDCQFDHPGARYGPRAIRAAGHVGAAEPEVGIDPLAEFKLLDYGDAPVIQGDGDRSSESIARLAGEVLDAGAVPLALGGDHWIANPCIRAAAARHPGLGLIHFDAHTDTDPSYLGLTKNNHSTVFRQLVEEGLVDGSRYHQLGIRGYYTFPEAIEWQRRNGIRTHWMHEVRDRGIKPVVEAMLSEIGSGPVYVTVDIDVLDPAFAPGTGTLEPGGMTTPDLLWAVREVASRVELVGADVVEVSPRAIEGADITAFAGHYVVREYLNGMALRAARRKELGHGQDREG